MSLIKPLFRLKNTQTGKYLESNFSSKQDAKKTRDAFNLKIGEDCKIWQVRRGKAHRLGES